MTSQHPKFDHFLWNLSSTFCEWVKHVDCVEFIDSSFAGLELIKQRRRQVKHGCLAVERHVCVFEKSQMLKVATRVQFSNGLEPPFSV